MTSKAIKRRDSRSSTRLSRVLTHWEVIVALVLLFALLCVAALPYSVWSPGAYKMNLAKRLLPPYLFGGTLEHAFGTDPLGRDLLLRILAGTRLTLLIGGLATGAAMILGTAAGLLAGYYRGPVDLAISNLVDMFLAFPVILLVLALAATLGRSTTSVALVLGFSGWARYTRVVRSAVIVTARQEYVESARAIGVSSVRIMVRHVVPNIATTILVMSTFNLAQFVLLESAVSFLGLGPAPPSITWGGLVGTGREYMYNAWWLCLYPGLAISLLAVAVSVIGDALRDAFDPHMIHT